MSLQDEFELCLEYAEALESKQEQREQAQNSIIFMQNESERLKNKLRLCLILTVVSVVAAFLLLSTVMGSNDVTTNGLLPMLIFPCGIFIVSLFNGIKAKKESSEFESQKTHLIQQYTAEAEECDREITRLIQEIYREDLFSIVPVDYFYTAAIEFCLTQVRKRLANTAREAFQQLDAEIKRLEHMEHLEQMNYAQMEQLNNIKRAIDINTLVTLAEQDKRRGY